MRFVVSSHVEDTDLLFFRDAVLDTAKNSSIWYLLRTTHTNVPWIGTDCSPKFYIVRRATEPLFFIEDCVYHMAHGGARESIAWRCTFRGKTLLYFAPRQSKICIIKAMYPIYTWCWLLFCCWLWIYVSVLAPFFMHIRDDLSLLCNIPTECSCPRATLLAHTKNSNCSKNCCVDVFYFDIYLYLVVCMIIWSTNSWCYFDGEREMLMKERCYMLYFYSHLYGTANRCSLKLWLDANSTLMDLP